MHILTLALIPLVFFSLMAWASVYAIKRWKPAVAYMGIKTAKLILSVVILLVCCLTLPLGKQDIKVFLLTFASFYVVYLIFESLFFARYEKNLKRKMNNEKENETIA